MTKVAVIGASGIIGQHLHISIPEGIDARFTWTGETCHLYDHLNLHNQEVSSRWLDTFQPDVVVNLAGNNKPDAVEQNPGFTTYINAKAPLFLAQWCKHNGKLLIHLSSQITISPVNEYGRQKLEADVAISADAGLRWVIIRPTFVLGIRPFPAIGRENPAEFMLSGKELFSVSDRWFAVSFAWDVVDLIWQCCTDPTKEQRLLYVGHPQRLTRHAVATLLGISSTTVPSEKFPNLARRPLDTSEHYAKNSFHTYPIADCFTRLKDEYRERGEDGLARRSQELAGFLKKRVWSVYQELKLGFGEMHRRVAEDFRRNGGLTEDRLLDWYRKTDSYLWELTSYHIDPGFNYKGMCEGIATRLKNDFSGGRVLCLGDGVGDLSLALADAGLMARYNDLEGSRTWQFAETRFMMRRDSHSPGDIIMSPSFTFEPIIPAEKFYDAVVSLDFLEHVPNVEMWVQAIFRSLKPGGLFCAQNAFNMGSGPHGSIPMHLSVNDHYDRDWDPLLFSLGFVQLASNWYQKPL